MWRAEMRAAVRHSILKAVFVTLMEHYNLIAPNAIIVSNCFEKESNTVKMDKYLAASKWQICRLPLFPSTADSLANDDILSKVKGISRFHKNKKKTLKAPSWLADQLYDTTISARQVCPLQATKFLIAVYAW